MERERNVRKIAISFLVISILCLSVAFAMLSRKLSIAGSAKLDPTKWGVKFVEGTLKVDSSSTAAIDSTPIIKDNVTISNMNFTFNKPGDKVIYTVDIENESDINVIAKVNDPIKNGDVNDEDIQKVITFSLKYKDTDKDVDNTVLEKNTRVTLVITFNYDRDIIDKAMLNRINEKYPTGLTLSLNTLTLTFTQSDELANITTTTRTLPSECINSKTATYTINQEVLLCSTFTEKVEKFYVIEDTGDKVTMIAKKNLMVGNDATTDYAKKYFGMQAQDNDSKNYDVSFAEIDESHVLNDNYLGYWTDSQGVILSKYNSTKYPVEVYDDNSLVKDYVDSYVNKIKTIYGRTSTTGTLLTLSQLEKSGCDLPTGLCTEDYDWMKNSLFWTSYATTYNSISVVNSPDLVPYPFNYKSGVRPVITLDKSEM